ncbi:MAG: phosphopantothenoylcysteine decarboxylase [Verrucomicrobiaceae bacterium]|nr:MAG: phosphopantothenoylcysteine decarboxylase [Verrucomicrobiaceae bacterium]
MKPPSVLLGITGSIAAYKAAEIASQLTKRGCDVTAVMTSDAQEFITPLTLQVLTRNPVVTGLYDEKQSWRPGHIHLADNAALVLIAPATANILAKLAAGLADDALSAICLATRAPILHAPAMNGKMWAHPATVRNVETLAGWGHRFIGPEAGLLACGYEGLGRLWPVEGIVERALEILAERRQNGAPGIEGNEADVRPGSADC